MQPGSMEWMWSGNGVRWTCNLCRQHMITDTTQNKHHNNTIYKRRWHFSSSLRDRASRQFSGMRCEFTTYVSSPHAVSSSSRPSPKLIIIIILTSMIRISVYSEPVWAGFKKLLLFLGSFWLRPWLAGATFPNKPTNLPNQWQPLLVL